MSEFLKLIFRSSGAVDKDVYKITTLFISKKWYLLLYKTGAIRLKKFNKNRVVISLRTSSKQKAIESANKLTDRLETYWNTLRLELFHTKELKLSFLDNQKSKTETVKLSKALDTDIKLKGNGKGKLFHRTALKNISYTI